MHVDVRARDLEAVGGVVAGQTNLDGLARRNRDARRREVEALGLDLHHARRRLKDEKKQKRQLMENGN